MISNEEFNSMEPDQQLILINRVLRSGMTLQEIYNEIGIDSIAQNRKLEGFGYSYDKDQKQFVKQAVEGQRGLMKLTVEIDRRVYLALKSKEAKEGIVLNTYIEDLLKQNIEQEYFDYVDLHYKE